MQFLSESRETAALLHSLMSRRVKLRWRWSLALFFLVSALGASAAEHVFDFAVFREGQPPPGFRSAVTGAGSPGDWKILLDEVPPTLAPLTPQAPSVTRKPVLAQLSQDPTDEHFPLLIFEGDIYKDFTFSSRFKTVKGAVERMAGLAFRIQNETNYYVVRASSLGNSFRFYKVVNGARGTLVGPSIPIPSGVWHDLSVTCKGNQFDFTLDGQHPIPTVSDNTFTSGKVGFWTKSDSVSYFADAKIVYKPRENPAQALVRDALAHHSHLLDLKIFVAGKEGGAPHLVGAKDEPKPGQAGGKVENDVIANGNIYYAKDPGSVSVTMALKDRNGDGIAAVRFVMKTFPGQTEKSAVERAAPYLRELQAQVQSLQDLEEQN